MGWLSQRVVAARCFGFGVFRGRVMCARCSMYSGRVTHPTKMRRIPRGMGVPPVLVLRDSWGSVTGLGLGSTPFPNSLSLQWALDQAMHGVDNPLLDVFPKRGRKGLVDDRLCPFIASFLEHFACGDVGID